MRVPSSPAQAGLLAAAAALVALLGGRDVTGQPGFLEAIHNGATTYIPLDLFEAGVATFGGYAKGLLFIGIAVTLLLAGVLVGALAVRAGALQPRPGPTDALTLAAIAFLVAEAAVLPVFGAGLFGGSFAGDPAPLHAPLAVACLAYGIVFAGLRREAPGAASAPVADPIGRRSFLGRAFTVVGAGGLAISAVGVLARVIAAGGANAAGRPRPGLPGGFGPTPVVTPLEDFYVIAKDLLPPRVDGATWRLSVGGLVDRPREYSLEEVRAMPRVEGYRTLQCISNEVVSYGDLIGNQRWAACRVRDLLEAAGVRSGAAHVLWRSADGYTESLPVEVALDERTWLAYEMGPPGTPLAEGHGYPLRVLIAGRYGMKQPKWLTDIVVADHDEPGYWENRGWDRTAAVRLYSRIDDPRTGDQVPAGRPFTVSGVASAGDRGIARVEVSADGGVTWADAELERGVEGTGELTWIRWRAEVVSTQAGSITLNCRATDGAGNVQDGTPRPVLPSGATGWHGAVVLAVPAT